MLLSYIVKHVLLRIVVLKKDVLNSQALDNFLKKTVLYHTRSFDTPRVFNFTWNDFKSLKLHYRNSENVVFILH